MKFWAKRAVLSKWENFKNARATVKARAGEEHEVEVFEPFGFASCPIEGEGEAVCIPLNGSNDHLAAVGFTGGSRKPKPQSGGVIFYSSNEDHQLELTPDGKFLFTLPDGKFFNVEGDTVSTNMNIVTSGDVVAGGVSLKTHRHGSVRSGSSVSGAPV